MSANIFNSVLFPKVGTNRFDLSHDNKLTFDMGELIPTCVIDCIPGDKFSIKVENMMRFQPLISPVMHKVMVKTHYFFVPNRILWPEWEQWITGNVEVVPPFLQISMDETVGLGSVADYMGIPPGTREQTQRISALPFAAYAKIYDDYFRDQNLVLERFSPLVAGNNNTNYDYYLNNVPLYSAWMHDYFTAALPFAQKGDAVQIPLTAQDNIPVDFMPGVSGAEPTWRNPADGSIRTGAVTGEVGDGNVLVGGQLAGLDPDGTLTVDVQQGAADINAFRTAIKIQEWLERNARGGTRYTESIMAHFGVRSSDARLQRAEYMGGSTQNMVISEVLATAQETAENIPVGQMAGHGISAGGSGRFSHYCEEHGWIIGITRVVPRTAYMDGIERQFQRTNRFDYAWPSFAHLGEQAVFNQELYGVTETGVDPLGIFGYVPRYAEYKFKNSAVRGEMRTNLDFWHLARKFDQTPVLDDGFVECDPSKRIFAVTAPENDSIVAHIFLDISVVRKLPRFGIPSL